MILYAYSDETEFKRSESDLLTVIGNGIFITKTEINNEIIKNALSELNSDNEKDIRDLKTLERGYFHASDDSKNAHSYLCKSINKNISGCFRYSFFESKNRNSWGKEKSKESINRLTLGLSSLEFFSSKIDKVILTIENRTGFDKPAVLEWIKGWYRQLDILAYDQTSFLTYYPDFEIIISNKSNPGLQVADFILWTLNRANKLIPDEVWKKRLNFKYIQIFENRMVFKVEENIT